MFWKSLNVILVYLFISSVCQAQSQYSVTELGTLGGSGSQAHDINNSGQITGWANTSDGGKHAFVYSEGVMNPIITNLPSQGSTGYGINDNGEVTGGFQDFYSGENYVFFSDSSGQATGHDFDGFDSVVFLYDDDNMDWLDTLGGDGSTGYAINDNGHITGSAKIADGSWHAFIYSGGIMTDINTLIDPAGGLTLVSGLGINNAGQICGYGIDLQGNEQAFLLTPVPEPTTLLLLGLSALMARRQRL